MPYNYRYPIVLFLASFVLLLTGLLLQTLRLPGTQAMTDCMVLMQIIAIGWFMTLFFKSRYPVVIFVAGFILFLGGLAFKIMHWQYSGLIIAATLILMSAVITWLMVVMVKDKE